jgi:hypothetical protein
MSLLEKFFCSSHPASEEDTKKVNLVPILKIRPIDEKFIYNFKKWSKFYIVKMLKNSKNNLKNILEEK